MPIKMSSQEAITIAYKYKNLIINIEPINDDMMFGDEYDPLENFYKIETLTIGKNIIDKFRDLLGYVPEIVKYDNGYYLDNKGNIYYELKTKLKKLTAKVKFVDMQVGNGYFLLGRNKNIYETEYVMNRIRPLKDYKHIIRFQLIGGNIAIYLTEDGVLHFEGDEYSLIDEKIVYFDYLEPYISSNLLVLSDKGRVYVLNNKTLELINLPFKAVMIAQTFNQYYALSEARNVYNITDIPIIIEEMTDAETILSKNSILCAVMYDINVIIMDEEQKIEYHTLNI